MVSGCDRGTYAIPIESPRGCPKSKTKVREVPPEAPDSWLRVAPQLTPGEARQLQARAAADMRSVGGYVAWLLIDH